ncbi:MAG: polysaccharide deacetylase [Pseudomonadota bacterium]
MTNTTKTPLPFTVCLTFDFDALSLWVNNFSATSPGLASRGEFGAVAVPRILALLKKHDVPATFYVPGHTALAYPHVVQEIRDAGIEIGFHGWVHESPSRLEKEEERDTFEKGLAALDKVAGVRPVGYRSPAWDFSANTLSFLKEYEFLYDSSCMASDYYPYYLRQGDEYSKTEPFRFGELTEMVECPVSWHLDDVPKFEFIPRVFPGLGAVQTVEHHWSEEFLYGLENCPDGMLNLTMHPFCIGRGFLQRMLDRLITLMKSHEGVAFSTVENYARSWQQSNPIDTWAKENPTLTGEGSITSL